MNITLMILKMPLMMDNPPPLPTWVFFSGQNDDKT